MHTELSMKIAGPSNVVLLFKQLDNYSNVRTLISLELVAIGKTVAASSPGGQWLPFRGREAVPSLYHP